ncbi:hypothetical protein Aros01_05768 [Streptosporangium roseum]|uniref:Uncharacterized protein n=1 Tax=Streptosporangium roseum (strain ATCC 12428 / DSM 43021 / JCM 3005 / KCTC 9067 / NCIMB 10171 / NRRL 2505 / NI 9100) TaxID=479432 RepID=D2B1L2_STRRD|nr:hypothetical protein Sros_4444 [Streptosporangium roseum DSM 43021]
MVEIKSAAEICSPGAGCPVDGGSSCTRSGRGTILRKGGPTGVKCPAWTR